MGSSPVSLLDQNYEYINWKITQSGFEDQCLLGLISFTMSQSFKVSRLISGTMTEFIIREQHDSVTRRLHFSYIGGQFTFICNKMSGSGQMGEYYRDVATGILDANLRVAPFFKDAELWFLGYNHGWQAGLDRWSNVALNAMQCSSTPKHESSPGLSSRVNK